MGIENGVNKSKGPQKDYSKKKPSATDRVKDSTKAKVHNTLYPKKK